MLNKKLLSKKNVLFLIYIIGALFYIVWRIDFTLSWHVVFAPLMLIADFILIVNGVIFLYTSRQIYLPPSLPPLKGRTVDIFIPTYNESIDIVTTTVKAALRVRGVHTVFVLDDGARPAIKAVTEKLGAKYLARKTNIYAKAGNMNYGLIYSKAEFIAFFDCDHIPLPSFIEETLGYFKDKKLAFVQTPQSFYNIDSIQHRATIKRPLWNEQTMFYEAIQPAKNAFNAAFFCGSSALMRRKAIDSVYGFATGTATEDIHTSIRLHAKGWKSLFIPKKLAFGLAPEDMKEYHRQRVRWGAGSLGLLFRANDSPLRIKGLTFMQRLSYFHSTIAHLMGIYKLLYILMPVFTIVFIPALPNVSFGLYFFIHILFISFSYLITMQFSNWTFHFPYTEQFDIFNILPQIESLKGVIKVQKKFSVSIKTKVIKNNSYALVFFGLLFSLTMIANIFGLTRLINEGKNTLFIPLFWNNINAFFLLTILYYLISRSVKNQYNLVPTNQHIYVQSSPKRPAVIKGLSMHESLLELPIKSLKPKIKIIFSEDRDDMNITGQHVKTITKDRKKALAIYSFKLSSNEKRDGITRYFIDSVVTNYFQKEKESLNVKGNVSWLAQLLQK